MKVKPRFTAYKLHISDLHAGSYVRDQTGAFLETFIGPVTRVRLLGTIVQRYDNEEKKYSSLTLDDSTETIRIKAWREDCEKIAGYQIGDIIDVIGKVRQQEDGELFIVSEHVIKVEDVNVELLRELEIIELRQHMGIKTLPRKEPKKDLEKVKPAPDIKLKPLAESVDDVKDEVMRLIRTLDEGKGAAYKDLVKQSVHISEEAVETAILDLLNEGVIYEPEAGRYKEL